MRRALLMALAVALGLAALSIAWPRRAGASVDDWWPRLGGARPADLADPWSHERPRRLDVDGVRLSLARGHADEPPRVVAAWYREHLADAAAPSRELPGPGGLVGFGDDERGGLGRLRDGRLRFVFYERDGAGGTDYVCLWSDDALPLARLGGGAFADVAGDDLDGVPRPGGARRVLAAGAPGQGELRAYRGPGTPLGTRDFYRAQLGAAGWREDEGFARFAAARERMGLHFRRGDRDLYLDIARAGSEVAVNVVMPGAR